MSKTLKEIHESQGGKFGYRVKARGWPVDLWFKPLAFDVDSNLFVWLDSSNGAAKVDANQEGFTLIGEPEGPLEIWVNYHQLSSPSKSFHDSLASAERCARAFPDFIRTVKFREVKDE